MTSKRVLVLGGLFVVAVLLGLGVSKTIAEAKKCDLKQIEAAYECPECGKISDNPGNCADCSTAEKAIVLKKIDACVKTGYACETDGKQSLKAGKCETCNKDLTATTVKSKIVYTCPECLTDYAAAGNCPNCKTEQGGPVTLAKACANSGVFPHVAE